MITFQVEHWLQCKDEASKLWPEHYAEVGLGLICGFKLDPDFDKLTKYAALGMLHIVVARKDGELVGYHASIVDTLLHYRTVLVANADLYWLRPDLRRGRTALRLFQEVERSLRARGVRLLCDGTKLSLDRGELFKFLGYTEIERRFIKPLA